MSKISEIVNGWGNYIKSEFNIISPEIAALAKRRLLICDICPIRKNGICSATKKEKNIKTGKMVSGCGCVIAAKTLSTDKNTKCPLGRW